MRSYNIARVVFFFAAPLVVGGSALYWVFTPPWWTYFAWLGVLIAGIWANDQING